MGTQGEGTGAATATPDYAAGTTAVKPGATGATATNATGGSRPHQTPFPPNTAPGLVATARHHRDQKKKESK